MLHSKLAHSRSFSHSHPAEFVLALGAGIHESLSDDGQRGVHDFRHMDVKDEVGILQNVHPKTQRKAAAGGQENSVSLENYSIRSIFIMLIYQIMS